MASSTTNLDLILPVGGENVSRQIINANNVKIDEAVGPVPSGTDLQSQVTALNNKIANVIKYQDTDYYYLNDQTWTETSSGKFYSQIPLPTGVTINGTVVGVMIQRYGSWAADDYIVPYSNQGTPCLMANKGTFGTNARIVVRILYIPT